MPRDAILAQIYAYGRDNQKAGQSEGAPGHYRWNNANVTCEPSRLSTFFSIIYAHKGLVCGRDRFGMHQCLSENLS